MPTRTGWRRHVYEDGSYTHIYDDATFHATVYQSGPNGWLVQWQVPPPNWPRFIAASSHEPSLARAKAEAMAVMRERRNDPSGTRREGHARTKLLGRTASTAARRAGRR